MHLNFGVTTLRLLSWVFCGDRLTNNWRLIWCESLRLRSWVFCGDCLTNSWLLLLLSSLPLPVSFKVFNWLAIQQSRQSCSRPSRLLFRPFWWISSITELKSLWLLFKWITLIKKENCQWNKWILRLWRRRRIYGITSWVKQFFFAWSRVRWHFWK